jgi:LDH2 family malate/lactate/ureidoglycolate dehydrogenase
MPLFSAAFWRYAGERASKTVAQAVIAIMGVSQAHVIGADWKVIADVALSAGLVSILTSLVAFQGAPAVADEPAPSADPAPVAEALPDFPVPDAPALPAE